jgi:acyl-CoA dehydrogenase
VERDPGLWRQLDDLGLVRLTGSEASGGSGAGWPEAAELLTAAVRFGVRIPLAEHDLLACWLLEQADLPIDDALRTVCVIDAEGAAYGVPWASAADRIIVVSGGRCGYRMVELEAGSVKIQPGTNAVGEPRDTVLVDPGAVDGAIIETSLVARLELKAAMVRAIQVCAALDRVLELTVEHAAVRIQFGRPLARLQAVQALIADIAAETALARVATEAALDAAVASDWTAPHLDLLVAAARSCAGHAASVVTRNAHQVHGAIGTTREHALHQFTRPALAWRSEFGSVRHWDEQLTRAALGAGGAGLWSMITG